MFPLLQEQVERILTQSEMVCSLALLNEGCEGLQVVGKRGAVRDSDRVQYVGECGTSSFADVSEDVSSHLMIQSLEDFCLKILKFTFLFHPSAP